MSISTATRTVCGSVLAVEVTIPGSASPATILSLVTSALTAAGYTAASVGGFRVQGLDSAGNTRDALLIGDSASNMKSRYSAGNNINPPVNNIAGVFISNTSASTDVATIELYVS